MFPSVGAPLLNAASENRNVCCPAAVAIAIQPRASAPSVYELPLGSIARFVCGPVPARLMSSTPPVIFPVPSARKLPAMATAPLASNPFIKYANDPDMVDSRPTGHAARPGALIVNMKLPDFLGASAAVASIVGVSSGPVGWVVGGV